MFKMGQKYQHFIKGSLENKRKKRNKRKQNETKIEIELNENQINNTNYDVQSCNDDETPSSKRINDEKDFDENKNDDDDKERQDSKVEAADNDVSDLINRLDNPEDQNRASDSDSDSDSDDENKQRNRVEPKDVPVIAPMKYNYGFFSGINGIFDKNDNTNRSPKKIRKTGKSLSYRVDGIFNDDESREVNHNVIISNIKLSS